MKGNVILYSHHEEIGRFPVGWLKYVYAWSPRNDSEDLLKVVVISWNDTGSREYFCDELEFE